MGNCFRAPQKPSQLETKGERTKKEERKRDATFVIKKEGESSTETSLDFGSLTREERSGSIINFLGQISNNLTSTPNSQDSGRTREEIDISCIGSGSSTLDNSNIQRNLLPELNGIDAEGSETGRKVNESRGNPTRENTAYDTASEGHSRASTIILNTPGAKVTKRSNESLRTSFNKQQEEEDLELPELKRKDAERDPKAFFEQ